MNAPSENESSSQNLALFQRRITDYARALNEKRDDDARVLMFEAFAIAANEAIRNPSPELVWKTLASDCEQLGNWKGAEEAYQKALELEMDDPNPGYPVKTLLDMASLHDLLGRKEQAAASIDKALCLARQSGIETLILMALEVKHLSALDKQEILQINDSSLKIITSLPEERVFDSTRARCLLLAAACAVDLGDISGAESSLARATQFVGGDIETPGRKWFHSRAAELSARIHMCRVEIPEAIAALENAVALQPPTPASTRGRRYLSRTLRLLSHGLQAAGRTQEADDARNRADELTAQNPH